MNIQTDLWQYLKNTEKPIVLYGMGNGADKIIDVLESYGVSVSGVFATDGFIRDKFFHGFKLSSYEELKAKFGEMIVLLCFGSSREEVFGNIKRISSEQEFFVPDVPVYGGGLFTKDYFEENQSDFEFIYSKLADETSRLTFINIINFKLSGKVEYLYNCETSEDEPYNSFLKLSNDEVFLDLGAYTGDTVKDFISRTENYKSITAVEPDIKTFKKLLINTADIKNLNPVNACVSNISGMELFAMRGGRNSSIGNGIEIKSVAVDDICDNATFIKMDIEGAELKAIKGAQNTILKNKPKLQIACYHRTEDLISLPKAVFETRNDYKLYLRHTPCVPAWDTNYYFI